MMKYLNDTIREVAQRINDKDFEDFSVDDYISEYKRASAQLAKKYQVFIRGYEFKVKDVTDNLEEDIILDIPDFKVENNVYVNNKQLIKVSNKINPVFEYVYYLDFINDEYHFNYVLKNDIGLTKNTVFNYDENNIDDFKNITKPYKKNGEDEVYIIYEALPESEGILNSFYIFPEMYKEELIKTIMLYMGELGLIKFAGSDKVKKYDTIYSLYKKDTEKINVRNTKFKDFIILKGWSILG